MSSCLKSFTNVNKVSQYVSTSDLALTFGYQINYGIVDTLQIGTTSLVEINFNTQE